MRIAILTFDAFNEIDSFVAFNILNRVQRPGWQVQLCAPTREVASMNGVTIRAQQPLAYATDADAVIVGSGRRTRELVDDPALLDQIRLEPGRQWIGAQCSGALWLARLGLLADRRVSTDAKTRPALEAEGITVVDAPFLVRDRVATAGGCLSGVYLAAWLIACSIGQEAASQALRYVAPIGEVDAFVTHALDVIAPHRSAS